MMRYDINYPHNCMHSYIDIINESQQLQQHTLSDNFVKALLR